MVTTLGSVASVLFAVLANSRKTIDRINQACADRNLPPAFKVGDSPFEIDGDEHYRFEGFGLIVGLPPKLSFYVHYKPDSSEHVDLGRFTVPISVSNFLKIKAILKG